MRYFLKVAVVSMPWEGNTGLVDIVYQPLLGMMNVWLWICPSVIFLHGRHQCEHVHDITSLLCTKFLSCRVFKIFYTIQVTKIELNVALRFFNRNKTVSNKVIKSPHLEKRKQSVSLKGTIFSYLNILLQCKYSVFTENGTYTLSGWSGTGEMVVPFKCHSIRLTI